MALVIGVPNNGTFYIDDTCCRVTNMRDEQHFSVEVPVGPHGKVKTFEITGTARVEVLPSVWISAGNIRSGLASLMIDAPRRVQILRGGLYERSSGNR